MKIIHEKCDPKLAQDKKLPYTAYLIQYEVEGKVEHDIAMGDSQVELFDHIKSYIDNSIEHTFEMVYNRMVLYEADVLHGPSVELGKFKNFSRITQVLFM